MGTKPRYTVTEFDDGKKLTYSMTPGNGALAYPPELLALLAKASGSNVEPQSPPTPTLTRLQPKSDSDADRAIGVFNKSLANTIVDGFAQNIVVEAKGNFTFDGIHSINSFRRTGKTFEGQGLYAGNAYVNNVTVSNSYFGFNGWQSNRKPTGKTMYAHGMYINQKGSITIRNVIVDSPCSQACKLMRDCDIDNLYIHRAAIGLSALYGNHNWRNVTVYGGSYYVDGTANVPNSGAMIYCPVTLDNCHFVGAADVQPINPTGKSYDMGCLISEKTHKQYTDVAGGAITATNCAIKGWHGPSFAGPKKHNGAGFVVTNEPASKATDAKLEALLKPLRDGSAQVTAELVKELQAVARGQ